MSLAIPLLILYGTIGAIALVTSMTDHDRTINQGYPAGQEIKVNFWTGKAKVSKKDSDRESNGGQHD